MDSCKYCTEPHGAFITDGLFEQSRIDCLQHYNDDGKTYSLCVNNSTWTKINFCPICGRDFSKEAVKE